VFSTLDSNPAGSAIIATTPNSTATSRNAKLQSAERNNLGRVQIGQGIKFTTQRVKGSLQALLKASLLRLNFGLVLVNQLLSLRLVSCKLGCLDSQTISFGLQQSVFGCEVIHLGLLQRLVGSSLSSNLWLPQRQANKQSKKFFEQRI
jgi:hypothetical protein